MFSAQNHKPFMSLGITYSACIQRHDYSLSLSHAPPFHGLTSSHSSSSSRFSPSVSRSPALFHSTLKTCLLHKSFPMLFLFTLYRTVSRRRSEKHSEGFEVLLRTDLTQDMDFWRNCCSDVFCSQHILKTFIRCRVLKYHCPANSTLVCVLFGRILNLL